MSTATGRIGALAQLFRFKPVASWGISAFILGAGIAYARVGADVSFADGLLALVLVALAQGYVSHGLNDAYDWWTGTDKESIGKGTGGSRVIPEGKMSFAGTILTALVALAGVLAIGAYFVSKFGAPMVVLIAIAVWAPVAYSVPPLKLGYRPFNELVIVVPAVTGVVVGADMVLAGSWSLVAVVAGFVHAMYCTSWFIVSRLPDYEPDKKVGKVTTVVYLGRKESPVIALAYLWLPLTIIPILVVSVSPVFVVSAVAWAWLTVGLLKLDPTDPEDASRVRLRNMHGTTAHAVLLAIVLGVFGV